MLSYLISQRYTPKMANQSIALAKAVNAMDGLLKGLPRRYAAPLATRTHQLPAS